MEEDLLLALRLQEEWNLQAAERDRAQEPLSLVDASWELVDPTPDLQGLFVQFNDRFFWGQLEAVEVKWSMRMTLCAGVCSYEGRGGMCSIRLSEPLLKLRPRKDLVETLLHEMIHAYLFVTNNDKDREGHGPEFCKHMHRINRLTGANITVYHTFHDEVDEYRRHWWRCSGPCKHKPPYYGYVKRATNRAPSANDYWWAEHQRACGGTYVKIKEPENYSKKGKGKTKLEKHPLSAVENKDKPSRGEAQLLIPFSGKGYVLGEASSLPSSGKLVTSRAVTKTPDLSERQSAAAGRPCAKAGGEFEQNVSSKKPHLASPFLNTGHQSVLSSYFPRVPVGDVTRNAISASSQRRVTASKVSLRNSSKAVESTPLAAPQDASASGDTVPRKRARLGDTAGLGRFFIQKEPAAGGGDPEHGPWPDPGAPGASGGGHHRLVCCPVCQREVHEGRINEHLDGCLVGEGEGGRVAR